jgi:ABC-type multidrug transport system ATPase subunit
LIQKRLMMVSELILNGILHLFALQASGCDDAGRSRARKMVEAYLSEYLGIVDTGPYIGLFDGFLDFYEGDQDPVFLLSRTTHICNNLAGHVPRTEQYVVLLRFFELSGAFEFGTEDRIPRLAETAGESFNIDESVIHDMVNFLCHGQVPEKLGLNHLLVLPDHPGRPEAPVTGNRCRLLIKEHFTGGFTVLHIHDIDMLFICAHHGSNLAMNGIPLRPGAVYLLPQGAIIRDNHSSPVYFIDIVSCFKVQDQEEPLVFTARHVDFRFPGSDNGLHDFCFTARGGQMIGVMGGSGVGKSTLINILNGSMPPGSGQLFINGRDLYRNDPELEGVIGYVPQDDLLFDELTVFENLFYSSRLCLAHLTKTDLTDRVNTILSQLNQLETRDLKVGSPLEKTISGGQRKRLNIALELIREPAILFVDEPTSGLSSADSLNVISLLKEQSNQGKLVIVIIHQPSSEIFKMFDALWILDKGGRPIYTGNPIDAVIYFRRAVWHAGTDECLCPQCGNVNPEQVFDIIETRQLDEKGYPTAGRRFSPEEWHRRHQKARQTDGEEPVHSGKLPAKALNKPGLVGQLSVFFQRNLLARAVNRQYLVINLLEAPLLAWVIAVIARYETPQGYLFGDNHNVPVYFFMSVIVALFMGLSVSAEEIIRDRKILSRERFLHLSWFSYINAKVIYLCLVSAIQMGLYVLVGNAVLQVPDFNTQLWVILFSCAVCASMIGLNISASLKTVVTIYIMIPLLLVPQIIMGGMVVSFDDFISRDRPHNRVPLVGNLMPSRWGFEAAVVEQFSHNRFQAPFNALDRELNQIDYLINYHIPELRSRIDFPFLDRSGPEHDRKIRKALSVLRSEFSSLADQQKIRHRFKDTMFDPDRFTRQTAEALKAVLSELTTDLIRQRSLVYGKRQEIEEKRIAETGQTEYAAFKKTFQNKSLTDLVRNRDNLDAYRVTDQGIVRLSDPIFTDALTPWGTAPMFAGHKQVGTVRMTTFHFNLMVLWLASCLLYTMLLVHGRNIRMKDRIRYWFRTLF